MTVSATTPTITYAYSGVGRYDFSFLTYDVNDIWAVHTNEEGLVTTLVIESDYSAVLNQGSDGGYITVINPDLAGGTLNIRRVLDIIQLVDWVNNSAFDMNILERSFDRVVMMMQQLEVTVVDGSSTTNWRGDWQAGASYSNQDIAIAPITANWYVCVVPHVASNNFDADLAAGYWLLALDMHTINTQVLAAQEAADDAEGYRDECLTYKNSAEQSAVSASNSQGACSDHEANSAQNAQEAANCRDEAYEQADTARYYADQTASLTQINVHQLIDAGAGSSVVLDWETADTFAITNMGGACDITTTGEFNGRSITITFPDDDSAKVITFPSHWLWPGGEAPEFSSDVDLVVATKAGNLTTATFLNEFKVIV